MKSKDTVEEIEREIYHYALHEASHAVAIWLCGGLLNEATIAGPKDENEPENTRTFCYVKYKRPNLKNRDHLTADDLLFTITAGLAPYVVEMKLIGQLLPGTLLDAQRLIRWIVPGYEDSRNFNFGRWRTENSKGK